MGKDRGGRKEVTAQPREGEGEAEVEVRQMNGGDREEGFKEDAWKG